MAPPLQEQLQRLQGLPVQFDFEPVFAELPGFAVKLEHPEANYLLGGIGILH